MFNSSGNTCDRCNIKCLNCSSNLETCSGGCADGTRNASLNCKCNVGKFSLVQNETCDQNCSYKCLNCFEVNGNCEDCPDVNRDASDSCNCKTGFYEDGVNNPTCGSNNKIYNINMIISMIILLYY